MVMLVGVRAVIAPCALAELVTTDGFAAELFDAERLEGTVIEIGRSACPFVMGASLIVFRALPKQPIETFSPTAKVPAWTAVLTVSEHVIRPTVTCERSSAVILPVVV
jgi:hypothetical protein